MAQTAENSHFEWCGYKVTENSSGKKDRSCWVEPVDNDVAVFINIITK